MSTYAIENDEFRYQELDFEVDDFIEYMPKNWDDITVHDFSKHNLQLKPHWKLLKTGFSTIEGCENLIPDITGWIGATLLLSPKAYRLLGDSLSPFGEFLPIVIDDLGEFQIFNCLSFNQEDLIHKREDDFCYQPHCSERLKQVITDFALKGVVFNNT